MHNRARNAGVMQVPVEAAPPRRSATLTGIADSGTPMCTKTVEMLTASCQTTECMWASTAAGKDVALHIPLTMFRCYVPTQRYYQHCSAVKSRLHVLTVRPSCALPAYCASVLSIESPSATLSCHCCQNRDVCQLHQHYRGQAA